MSWHFSQALEAAFLEENSWDGEQSARLKSIPFAPDDSASAKMKDTFHRSPYGMMFVPFEESLGADLLTWFLVDFLVRTLARQGKAQESPESVQDSGENLRELSVKYDRATHSWKTHRCLLNEDLSPSSVILPRWGTMQDGVLSERTTPERLTSVTVSGSWLTPTVMDSLDPRKEEALKRQHDNNRAGRTTHSTLREQVAYPPPAQMWPTPKVSAAGPDFAKINRSATGISLQTAVAMFPTPCATDHKGSGKTGQLRDRLDYAVERGATKSKKYPTPKTNGFCGGSGGGAAMIRNNENLSTEEKRSMLAGNGGQLNPAWVGWLMGWPIGWESTGSLPASKFLAWQQAFKTESNDSKPLETDKFRQWQNSHGSF